MTRGKEPPYNPEAGLPGPEDELGRKADPETAAGQDFRNLERQLSNVAAPREKHSPMVMYQWVDSRINLYGLPDQEAHRALLKGLVYDNLELRHKILHAMAVEEQAKRHGIENYPVKALLEEILDSLGK